MRLPPTRALCGIGLAGVVGVAFLGGCLSDGAIVGGECDVGLTECAQQCVDLMTDPTNCGGCGLVCSSGQACVAGRCGLSDGSADGPDVFQPSDAKDASKSEVGEAGSPDTDACLGENCPDVVEDRSESDGSEGGEDVPDAPPDIAETKGDVLEAADDASDALPDTLDEADAELDVATEVTEASGDVVDSGDESLDAPGDSADESLDASGDIVVGDGDDGEAAVWDGCTPPYDNDLNCGACGAACGGATPKCKPSGDGGVACGPFCDPPLSLCGDECKDLKIDPENCGYCYNGCITGLCVDGKCAGSAVGHLVLIGMNYHSWYPGSPPSRLFANAVFLPLHTPLRVLEYAEYGDKSTNGAVEQVTALLQAASVQLGRPYDLTEASQAQDVVTTLVTAQQDVLLIHDQPNADAGVLGGIGTSWASALSGFVHSGGVVVTLMTASGQNEMPSLVTGTGLGSVEGMQDITTPLHILSNNAPYDAVGINVLSPFLARPETSVMKTSMLPGIDTVFVVMDATHPDAGVADPVVIHRVFLP